MFPSGSPSLPSKKGKEIMEEEEGNGREGKENSENQPLPPEEEEEVVVETPEWLHMLLRARFWKQCEEHSDESRSDVSLFCLRCYEVVCPRCTHDEPGHRLLKVRRYVYRSVVLVKDMQDLDIDVSRIQTYIVNGRKGVHLRPMKRSLQFRPPAGVPRCLTCSCSLRNAPNQYCSLSCKRKAGVSQDDYSGPEAERRHRQQVQANGLESQSRHPSPQPLDDASPVADQHHMPVAEHEYGEVEANPLESLSQLCSLQQSDAPPVADQQHPDNRSLRARARKQAKPLRAPFF